MNPELRKKPGFGRSLHNFTKVASIWGLPDGKRCRALALTG
jgi:hypothetical protein